MTHKQSENLEPRRLPERTGEQPAPGAPAVQLALQRSGHNFVAETRGGGAGGNKLGIKPFEIRHDRFERHVGERPAVLEIFHVPSPGLVERMEQAVIHAVEVKRFNFRSLAQRRVRRPACI